MRWNIVCKRRYKPTQFYALSCVSCRSTCKCTMLHVHTCTNRSYGIRENRWKLYRSLRQVLNWAAMSYLFLCRLFLPSEQLYCQFLSSSLNSRRCFQTFCHLTTRKRKGNTFYKRKLHKAFWDLHLTSFKLSVALFVRLNCLCTGGIDQTDVML